MLLYTLAPAGFDPRLSGWDNALLRCVLMRISVKDSRERLPQMHDFCELAAQMSDPLSIYQSGMQVNLGFALAISMDVDQILMEEVFAVWGQSFREKRVKAVNDTVSKGCAIVLFPHSPVQLRGWINGSSILKVVGWYVQNDCDWTPIVVAK